MLYIFVALLFFGLGVWARPLWDRLDRDPDTPGVQPMWLQRLGELKFLWIVFAAVLAVLVPYLFGFDVEPRGFITGFATFVFSLWFFKNRWDPSEGHPSMGEWLAKRRLESEKRKAEIEARKEHAERVKRSKS